MKPQHLRLRADQLQPVYSPRTSLKLIRDTQHALLNSLTLNIDKFTITDVKACFQSNGGQLALVDLLNFLRRRLNNWQPDMPNRQIRLLRCLVQLYKQLSPNSGEIDLNKTIDWDKFTNYIIGKVTLLKSVKVEETRHFSRSKAVLRQKITTSIAKVVYVPEIDRIAYFQEGGNKVLLMSHETGQIIGKPLMVQPKKLMVESTSIKKEKDGKNVIKKKDIVIPTQTIVLDILYIPDAKYKVLLTSSNDGIVRGWKYSGNAFLPACQPQNQQQPFQHQFSTQIYCMAWDSLNQILYCSDKNGMIVTWNIKTDIEKPLEQSVSEGHSLIVMSMVTMPKLQFMASGGMDGKLILWDTINNVKKWVYRQHTRGILSVTFNQSLILLFSGGFDHQICIWNPYISNLIHKLNIHTAPVLCLQIIESTGQLVSLDDQNILKFVDTRKFNVVSSLSAEHSDDKQDLEASCFAIIPKPLRLAVGGKTMCMLQYDRSYNPSAADDSPALVCKYLPSALSLYTPVANKVKLWSILTGEPHQTFQTLLPGDLTAFEFDNSFQRFIAGDQQGHVALFNVRNGVKWRDVTQHSAEILFVLSIKALKVDQLFVTVGADNEIRILKENVETGRFEKVRVLHIKKDLNITAVAYSDRTKSILVGTNYGVIGFYEIETGKLAGSTPGTNPDVVITSICLIDDYNRPFIIQANSAGRISFIATPPHYLRYSRIFSFVHPDHESPSQQAKITCCTLANSKLYVGDDKGCIKCYNLIPVFEELDKLANQQNPSIDQFKNRSSSTVRESFRINITEVNFYWSIRAHNESIKNLEYIYQEGLLVSISYDKRVKIWSSETGIFVDQLQQNPDRTEPKPVAFRRLDTGQFIKLNYKDKIPLSEGTTTVADVTPLQLEMNPRCLFDKLDDTHLDTSISNQFWKVFPGFDQVYRNELNEYKHIVEAMNRKEEIQKGSKSKSKHDKLTGSFVARINSMKVDNMLGLENSSKITTESPMTRQDLMEESRVPAVSEITSQQKLQREANQPNKEKEEKEKLMKKHYSLSTLDKFGKEKSYSIGANGQVHPLLKKQLEYKAQKNFAEDIKHMAINTHSKTHGLTNNREMAEHQREYCESLYRKESVSKLYYKDTKKVTLSQEEAAAAYNLSAALSKINKLDMRVLKFVNNIVVKQETKLPRI